MPAKKSLSFIVSLLLLLGLMNTASAALPGYGDEWENATKPEQTLTFTDLPKSHWAYQYIAELLSRKVISGYPDNKFRPDNQVSRAEFARIMVSASGIPAKKVNYSSYSDLEVTNWASPFVESVKDYMTGYRTANGQYIFNPDAPALREEVAVALVKLKGYDKGRLPDHSTIKAMFKDYDGISEAAKDYVAIAVENGLVSGFPDETFRPQATITRAEATVMLWRAYQYGNDNKGVGGGEQTTTPSQPTTPASPTTPTTNPTEPDKTQQPAEPEKFTVETLVGGNGTGDVDGPVRMAKINQVDSMVVDKDNNVYFLDSQNKKIRKFNSSNGTVETYRTIDKAFNWDYIDDNGQAKHFDYTSVTPMKLAYNYADNKLYLAAKVATRSFIYDITTGASVVAYDFNNEEARYFDFIAFPEPGSILYGVTGSHDSHIYQGQLSTSQVERIASSTSYDKLNLSDYYGYAPIAGAFASNSNLYVFGQGKVYNLQLFPIKVDLIADYGNSQYLYGSATAHGGKLYVTKGATIYEIGTAGNMITFVDSTDLTYKDGTTIKKISQIDFDNNGNVIAYDDDSKSIRRINL